MKTVLYIFCSVILILVGVVLLFALAGHSNWIAISTSILAGGISSVAFAVIKFFDDRDSSFANHSISLDIKRLEDNLRAQIVVRDDPDVRCIFDRHPKSQVAAAVKSVREGSPLEVDLIAFSLGSFHNEQADLFERPGAKLRLIVQDPMSESFKIMAEQEGRDGDVMAREILHITDVVIARAKDMTNEDLQAHLKAHYRQQHKKGICEVELRWFSGIASITSTRINDIVFVRSRLLNEGGDGAQVFFEKYSSTSERCFGAYAAYFSAAWEKSRCPTVEDLRQLNSAYAHRVAGGRRDV